MPAKNKKTSSVRTAKHTVHRHVKKVLVPHAANQYRPHLIRRHGLVAVLLIVIVLQFVGSSVLPHAVLGDRSKVNSIELLDQTNAARKKENLPALQLDEELSQAAYLKASDMITRQYWAHDAPDGTQPWKWLGDVEYNYSYAGENLAKNFSSSRAVVNAWLDSRTHRDNVLKPQYQDVGFAVVDGEIKGRPISIVVALYGTPAAAAVQGVSDFAAAPTAPIGMLSSLGLAVQSASPAMIGSAVLLLFTAAIAGFAHIYRRKLPRSLQKTWYRHHGAYKAIGLTSLLFIVVALYGTTGQI